MLIVFQPGVMVIMPGWVSQSIHDGQVEHDSPLDLSAWKCAYESVSSNGLEEKSRSKQNEPRTPLELMSNMPFSQTQGISAAVSGSRFTVVRNGQ